MRHTYIRLYIERKRERKERRRKVAILESELSRRDDAIKLMNRTSPRNQDKFLNANGRYIRRTGREDVVYSSYV